MEETVPLILMIVSLVGGAIGVLVGVLIAWVITVVSPLTFAIPLWSIALGLGSGLI